MGLFAKIDPILADVVLQSKPNGTSADAASKKNSSTSNKRKSEPNELLNGSPKKKANVESSNGSLTLSQREKRAMELLASYLEERGGMYQRHWHTLMSYCSANELIQSLVVIIVIFQGSECKVKAFDARLSFDLGDVMIPYFFLPKISVSSLWPKLLDFST